MSANDEEVRLCPEKVNDSPPWGMSSTYWRAARIVLRLAEDRVNSTMMLPSVIITSWMMVLGKRLESSACTAASKDASCPRTTTE